MSQADGQDSKAAGKKVHREKKVHHYHHLVANHEEEHVEGEQAWNTGLNLLVGALWELPALVLALFVVEGAGISRKTSLHLYLWGVAMGTLLIVLASYEGLKKEKGPVDSDKESFFGTVDAARWLTQFGFACIKFFTSFGFLMVYVVAVESYPTKVRATGTALVFAMGRLGSIACAPLYEMLAAAVGVTSFYLLNMVLCALNIGVLSLVNMPETKNASMDF